MSKFRSDLNHEAILSKYLDTIYKSKKIDFIRVNDLDRQHQGIDIILSVNSKDYLIDEKAQLHYLNKDLPTFTFELSYLKNDEPKVGWLLDDKKLTQYYFLITGIILKNNKTKLTTPNDIDKIKITSVDRRMLIHYLKSIQLTQENLLKYNSVLRKNKSFGKNEIKELNSKTEGLIYFTEHLSEQPINLQLKLKFLITKGIAKEFYYI